MTPQPTQPVLAQWCEWLEHSAHTRMWSTQHCRSRPRGVLWLIGGISALGGYGPVATFQPVPHFGWFLVTYGAVFVAGRWLGPARAP